MSRQPIIKDIRPVQPSSRPMMRTGLPPVNVKVGVSRGWSSSPMRMPPRPLSSSTPAVKERPTRCSIQQSYLQGDSLGYEPPDMWTLFGNPNDPGVAFLEDFEKPKYLVTLESLTKINENLKTEDLERGRLEHIAERNKILPLHLIPSVDQEMESMISSIEKFSSNSASETILDPVEASIPCPINKRKEMVQVFENMENIRKCKFTFEEIDERRLEGYVQDLISKTGTKISVVQKSIAELKKTRKRNIEQLHFLNRVKK